MNNTQTAEALAHHLETLNAVADVLANGAHYTDDPECHPLFPNYIVALQAVKAALAPQPQCDADLLRDILACRAEGYRVETVQGPQEIGSGWKISGLTALLPRIIARLSQPAPANDDWHPIETIPLPKNGKVQDVLVYIPNPEALCCNFEVTSATGKSEPEVMCWGLGGDIPTHWMPLPAPPQSVSEIDPELERIIHASMDKDFNRKYDLGPSDATKRMAKTIGTEWKQDPKWEKKDE